MLQSPVYFFYDCLRVREEKSRCEGSKPSRCISQSVVESWQPCHVQPLAERKKKVFLSLSLQKTLEERHLDEEALAKQNGTGGHQHLIHSRS